MGIRDLFFALTATDKTGPAFDSVGKRLRDVEGAAATMGDRLNRTGAAMQRLGLAGSVASAGVVAAFRGSLDDYDAAAKAQAKVAQAITATGGAAGFTAEELGKQAAAFQAMTRFDGDDVLNNVTAQLLTFKNISGPAFLGAQVAALDLATTLDGDLQSASIMLGKALNDPIKGLSALGRAGVQFSTEQTATIKALAETGDIAAAQKLILDEIAGAYGGQAAAARQTGAGIRDAWLNTWGDIREDVGQVLAGMLPTLIGALQTLADAFNALTPKGKEFAVMAGLIAVALPPVIGGLGLVVAGLGAITGPVGLVTAGLIAAAGAAALFWPETEKLSNAADDLVISLGDEIRQSQLLDAAISGNIEMSVGAARQKLTEAKARHENVAAIIAEQRALALQSGEYASTIAQIKDTQNALRTIGFPANDKVLPERADAFEATQQRLVDLVTKQQDLLKTDKALADQYALTLKNMQALEGGIAAATGSTVRFGDALIVPIEPAERLTRAVGTAGLAGALGSGSGGLADAVDEAAGAGETLAQSPFWGDLKSNLGSTIKGAQDWGDAWDGILSSALDKLFDLAVTPAWDQIGAALSDITSGSGTGTGGSGKGGGLGGLLSGAGNILGGLLGFDTGGAFTVRGRAGMDRNTAAVRLSEGEEVQVTRRGAAGAGGATVVVNIQTPDPQAFASSRAQIGQRISRAVAQGQRAD